MKRELKDANTKIVEERATMLAERVQMRTSIEDVDDVDEAYSLACMCREGAFMDISDISDTCIDGMDVTAFAASLDVQDYLQRDADGLFETAFLSLRSDTIRDPRSPGYDMSVPPANHREAMMRTDALEWKKVEDKELEMLKSMGVYVEEMLPERRKR
jgi:hypothetical protein